MTLQLPREIHVSSDAEAAQALEEAEAFFLFVLESVAMMNPRAIRPGFLQEFDVAISDLVIAHDIPQA